MMDAADRALLDDAVRGAIGSAHAAAADAGTGLVGDAEGEDVLLDEVLADLGWLEMLEAEPRDAVGVVFGALGATNGVATALDDVVVAGLGLTPRSDLAVVLPRWGHVGPVGGVADAGADARVTAAGLATHRVTTATDVLVVVTSSAGPALVTLPADAVTHTRVHGLDPWFGWQRVHVDATVSATDVTPLDPAALDAAVAAGQRAVAHQIEGACRTAIDQARTHALTREQFGGPIARFQALRHRLADAFVATEAIESALLAAWDDEGPLTAALAKAIAARSARVVAAQVQQVLAGIGFTTDHPFHRTLKRMMVLEGVLGSADTLALELGRYAIAERSVPTLVEL